SIAHVPMQRVHTIRLAAEIQQSPELWLRSFNGDRWLYFNPETGEWYSHVELGLWADLFIIAPVTANTLAKMASGVADNYLLTVYLSARCKILFAPAMDKDMFLHPSTQRNIKTLQEAGNILLPPAQGELASGLCGEGRMREPEEILSAIKEHFRIEAQFNGKKVLVTAGPTYEAIDPVRFIGNYSSGKMGYSIAAEFASRGADVILVSGPVNLDLPHPSIKLIGVQSAEEMKDHCLAVFPDCDITIMAAAVADYTPESTSPIKLKKKSDRLQINLIPTDDILKKLGSLKKNHQFLAGFALETDNETDNAREKLIKKNLDVIFLNSLNDPGAGFGHATNKISIIDHNGITPSDLKSKTEVARDIVDYIFDKTKSGS
ncbi:MAG: bifunctional phosphopantothenoylcysteine decarboxylase/phosphopantothenate--cysteine ligase CoaBC, partial [Bacteroidetes bacterium]|nr:bifunctional phosphopantothenoylcysteine decarboxylase/phosphopantothenate--cysteine ligase CoaBC [Bacteroidota bacterium]